MKATRNKQVERVRKQLNVRVERAVYRTLEAVARQDRSSVPQTAKHLLESGLRQRLKTGAAVDDTSAEHLASLATAGRSFDWLADEPELYDDTCGQPVR